MPLVIGGNVEQFNLKECGTLPPGGVFHLRRNNVILCEPPPPVCLGQIKRGDGMQRREILAGAGALCAANLLGTSALAATGNFEVQRSDAEWRSMLSKIEYKVMRKEGTERSGSSPLDKNWADGTYHCRGCDLALYPSKTKFDSGTGWPSFWQSLPNSVSTMKDRFLLRVRTEVHCRRCGSHLGHIFDDGPKPTGKRHCLNGASLVFNAA